MSRKQYLTVIFTTTKTVCLF